MVGFNTPQDLSRVPQGIKQAQDMNQYGPPLPPGWTHAFTPQGQPLLLCIIKMHNLVTANKEQHKRQTQEWRDKREEIREKGSAETLQECVDALQEKVCVKGFPPRETTGAEMATELHEMIEDVMGECVNDGRMTMKACQKMLFELLLALIKTGPGTATADIIQDRLVKTQETYAYLEALRGNDLTRIIDSLKMWTHIPEGREMSVKKQSDYWGYCTSRLVTSILGDYKSDKVYEPEIHQQFLDLYLFYFIKMGKEPDEYADHISDVMITIKKAYSDKHDKNPYLVLQKKDILLKHWKAIGVTICSKSFGNEHQVKKAEELVNQITTCVMKNEWTAEVWDDVLDVMKKFYITENAKKYKDVLRGIRVLLEKTPEEMHKKHPELVDKLVPVVTELLEEEPANMRWANSFVSIMTQRASAKKGTEQDWFPLLKALMKTGTSDGAYNVYDVLYYARKFKTIWNWKQNFQHAIDILKPIGEVHLHLTGKKDDDEKMLKYCGDIVSTLLEQFTIAKIPDKLNGDLAVLAITMMEKKSEQLNVFVERFIGNVTLGANRNVIPGVIRRFSMLLFDRDYMWNHFDTKRCGRYIIQSVLDAYNTGKDVPDGVNRTFIRMFLWAMQTEDLDYIDLETGTETLYNLVASQFLRAFVDKHVEHQNSHVCVPLMPAILKQMEHEETDLATASSAIVANISSYDPKLLHGQLGLLVDWCKETSGSMDAISALQKPYEESDGFTKQEFKDVMTVLEKNSARDFRMECMLLKSMAEKQPELFTQHHVDFMVKHLGNKDVQYYILLVLGEIIPTQPQLFGDNMVKHVLRNKDINPMCSSAIQMIAVNLGLKKPALADTILKELITLTQNCKDPTYQYPLLDAIQILAAKYGVDSLKPHRKFFEDLQQNGRKSFLKDIATSIVNAMDGISLQGIAIDVIKTKKKVIMLDKRVTKTEKEVKGLKTTVDRHDKEIKTVKTGIKTVTKRVDVVEKDLEETKVKIEEIDNKTMSNGPAWSRDLTKLMNPKSEHDWRLLAQRLGYTPKEIKAWATQNDPCMALLSEWYATHKTVEASHAVLTILQEMNRLDAVIILENAMKAVEDVVEEAQEYTKPPPIFLSYQWGHQNEVKLLRQHLLMAGYECWLDIGQMGGGDKLFEKIDNGIRGAKVIICCVSEKYAKSPNCNREVNLSVNLGKPMIPLLMEKMGWPPQGSMGPIFSEYLFVRFFQRKGEETKDQRYWPVPKLQELLMQLNMYKTMPDESLITKEYKDWWVPVAEEIKITKKPQDTGGQSTATTAGGKESEGKSPDVFLSYQWGKQTQIKQLYKRLCELGLTCWMDIYQMGGGDSLYDKIDQGVRGCKIVLSCVTSKYAVSANCRREVSLADSLKKPVVPLLLEKMDWPPSGPMSMVFTQLLFINFYRDEEVQMTWTGNKFDELLAKITENVPNTIGYLEDTKKKGAKETPGQKVEPRTAVKKESDQEYVPPPPPIQYSEQSQTAQTQAQPPPYTYNHHSAKSQPASQLAQPQSQPYSQLQHYGHQQQNTQQQPYGHRQVQPQQQMYGQAQPHMQHAPRQAAPTQASQTNEKSSSCVLL
ncbi:hypothetical protein KP79_PYT09249 [Mizuhopecten yessoensis]|uniref:Uncharacterized protein n=1 Tax=Mizuhopecten yessoensis TaxID=6573 RepID=A0A210PWG4_MIZYE|nr:hypothetical protein KP79_PYT09249 [Mizuhopecten yessoensis]